MKKKGFFVDNYSKCWKFLLESRWYVVSIVALFALTILIGFIFPVFFRQEIFDFIAKMIAELEGKSTFEIITFIFFNNMKASFMSIVLGVTFGIFPLVATVMNGYLIGFVSRHVVEQEGLFALWRLLPHGVFELPAIIFSIGIGLKIGISCWPLAIRGKGKLKYTLKEGLRFFVFVVFPLLLVAGIIEGVLIGLMG